MKRPEQQNNTLWLPTPKKRSKTEDHISIQKLIHTELLELKEKEKLNPQ